MLNIVVVFFFLSWSFILHKNDNKCKDSINYLTIWNEATLSPIYFKL